MIQTVGRAARNINGTVIMYADRMTDSMRQTIEETERRRAAQFAYNEEHGITPTAIVKARQAIIGMDDDKAMASDKPKRDHDSLAKKRKEMSEMPYIDEYSRVVEVAADPIIPYMTQSDMKKAVGMLREQMVEAAKRMDFMEAARLRDEMLKIEDMLAEKDKK